MKGSFSIVFRVLFVIFISLLLINYVRLLVLGSGSPVTFDSILDLVHNYQSNFSLTNLVNFQNMQITGSWGLIDGLRIFINSLVSIFVIGVYLALNLADVINFIAYFLSYIFVV